MAHLLILYIMTTLSDRKERIDFMKRFFMIAPCLFILLSLLFCACTDAEFLTEETFLNRFNALDETQQLKAEDALAKEEDAFIGHSYFLSPKGDETYLLNLYIDKETAKLKSCSLLYARLDDEESDAYFAALVSRTAQAFTGYSAPDCEDALKKAGIIGAAKADPDDIQTLEWNGFRIKKETISLGQKMTIETLQKEQASESESIQETQVPSTEGKSILTENNMQTLPQTVTE